jgi:hypothetical protein
MDKSDINRLNKSILSLQYYSNILPYISVCIAAILGAACIIPLHAESVTERLGIIFIGVFFGYYLSKVITKILDALVQILQSQVEMIYRLPSKSEEPEPPVEVVATTSVSPVVEESPVEVVAVTSVASSVVEEPSVKEEVTVEAPKEPEKVGKKVSVKRKTKA